jgi:hypothetical protein
MSADAHTEPDIHPRHAAYVAGLREMADFVEARPDLVGPGGLSGAVDITLTFDENDRFRRLVRAMGGGDKRVSDRDFIVERHFGPHQISVRAWREAVCQRVVVGTETVTETVVEPEAFAALPRVERSVEREIVEWVCPESILSPGARGEA